MALVRRQWELSRGMKFSGLEEAALAVHEDLISWMRKAADISSSERARLGFYLTSYGVDLMGAKRYDDAYDTQTEGITLLRALMSAGEDCASVLVSALQLHAQLAALSGDRPAQRSRLEEALTVIDSAGAADWVDEARTEIQAKLDAADNA
ncbi:hypothetical protein [Mycobacterium deserti]|uniref:DNA-binding protein n=1 Tax=Mycobacterium deserti TaxID=2978347 RepID=A0ABT2MA40_9MYCO|nr:hypothetical protein [Mycobacterium deserti]MCT7658035.1 hypothetical protein [Mycobacterium deserti]